MKVCSPKALAPIERRLDEECTLAALSQAMATTASAADSVTFSSLESELRALYEQHSAALVRYASSYARDPEAGRDAVQDAFIRYFQLRRTGANVGQPKAWLTTVIKNCLNDRHRRGKRLGESDAAATGERYQPQTANSGAGFEEAEAARLWESIEKIVTPRELTCLRMRAAGFSYAEIGEVMGVQSGTVSAFVTRSREKARPILNPQPSRASGGRTK